MLVDVKYGKQQRQLSLYVVKGNGPQFTSDEFTNFMQVNGIKHIKCALNHPASNGAVECLVQYIGCSVAHMDLLM